MSSKNKTPKDADAAKEKKDKMAETEAAALLVALKRVGSSGWTYRAVPGGYTPISS